MDKISLLRNIPAFARLVPEHLALLAASLGTQSFERGEIIFHQASIGSTLYIIVRGQVRIFTTGEEGQEHTLYIFRDGEFFGELALLDGLPRSASAEAMCATITLTLHRAAFLHTLETCPSIGGVILEALAARLRQSTTSREQIVYQSAPQRVGQRLVELAHRYGVSEGSGVRIDLRLTQDDLASLSGTTRETVNRVLAGLRDRGLIRVARGRVSVLDIVRLEQIMIEL